MEEVAPEAAKAKTAAPFGTAFTSRMTLARYSDGQWQGVENVPVGPLPLHPASHVLHYGSTCFEGLKAYRMPDGEVKIFRLDQHVARFQRSAALLCLPQPPADMMEAMIREVVALARDDIPEAPGALYLRPTLIGTEENIGAAGAPSAEAMVYVLASPVGDYFAGGRGLNILIEDREMRSTPGFGQAKTGGNYASALRHVVRARKEHGADQVLFCPNGDVQETGASNFFLIDDNRLLTKPLDPSFLHGVTRDSVITLARDLGYEVIERDFTVDEIKDWIRTGEAALSGTAAVLSGVGAFIHDGTRYQVGDGGVGPNTRKLSEALRALQSGRTPDRFGWLS
ncbi:branched-chain amino acid aminotransferase [Marinobacter halodurans]|uniref:Branched-chain-amino-acid aminotransferase n=1 Tax=Marinobacter halodurans TaxID=2528979 RepID=A0ABY1ZPR3_9GAMM|nr:branched-chain amino acid aminotransferase [Marinobacter halodurans]TBW58588.1 branched-chain amino acid aminotransferase [Marinobacter halodurans]